MPQADSQEPEDRVEAGTSAAPQRRPPTSVDVARLAGVSQATVSYVLNELPNSRVSDETRARVLAAADELGYTTHAMARSLRSGQSDIILLPQFSLPTGPMVTQFYEGLAARLGARGYKFIMHLDPAARGIEAARVWASLRPIGVLVEAARVSRRSIELLRLAGTRAVMVMAEAPSQLAPTLVNNDSDIGACAAEYLIAKGHQRLAVLVPRDVGLLGLGLERFKGVERVARVHGISVERIDIGYDASDAARVAARWAQAAHPTGVFAYNDDYAMLLMRALLGAGVAIPHEIAVVGADDLPFGALLNPPLTSVHKADMAGIDEAADAFHALIQGTRSDIPPIQLLQPRIVIRDSA
jgi:DNA-binding LacI/PurR family transcriptional regulator